MVGKRRVTCTCTSRWGGVGLRLNAGLAAQRGERCRLCLLGVERELALVDCLLVELLGAGEGGVVGERAEVAADDEGVADVDGGAEHHQQRERQQQPGDQHRAALIAEPRPGARVMASCLRSRLR